MLLALAYTCFKVFGAVVGVTMLCLLFIAIYVKAIKKLVARSSDIPVEAPEDTNTATVHESVLN